MLTHKTLVERFEQLTTIGVSLSRSQNITQLLENILLAAKSLTHADGGSLYRVYEQELRFEIIRTDSLNIAMGGTTGQAIQFPPVQLYRSDGQPNEQQVVAYAVLHDQTVNIPDAYTAQGYDFSGTKRFDAHTGYRSQAFLTVPMKNHENEIIGVLQLINPIHPSTGKITPFSEEDQRLVEALASQAAVALTNRLLFIQQQELFEALIRVINIAIDEKSPHTGKHCERVPVLTMMLAEAANLCTEGIWAPFHLNDNELYELKIASLLHDCGKVTTPVHIIDKSTKLETIHDRIHELDARFAVLRQSALIAHMQGKLSADAYQNTLQQLAADRQFLHTTNLGGEFMSAEKQARVRQLATQTWENAEGILVPLLSAEECEQLCIARGTLSAAERQVINNHIVATLRMLEALPWPKHLKHVPEYAGGHHERMDGKGYPRGLTREQMSWPARMMGIADVFEALTAKDRPYKPGKTLSETLAILGRMAGEGHIDPDLFDLFVRKKVYLHYAQTFLDPEQIDEVDENCLPNYHP